MKLTDGEKQRVRDWLLDKDRIRFSLSKAVPTEQDIQDVIAVLEWPEYEGHCLEVGASVIYGDLQSRRIRPA